MTYWITYSFKKELTIHTAIIAIEFTVTVPPGGFEPDASSLTAPLLSQPSLSVCVCVCGGGGGRCTNQNITDYQSKFKNTFYKNRSGLSKKGGGTATHCTPPPPPQIRLWYTFRLCLFPSATLLLSMRRMYPQLIVPDISGGTCQAWIGVYTQHPLLLQYMLM